jgi:tetraacyldisaccharide 4'-kinase
MDDGHQNPSLKKSLSLVVVDGETRDGEWPFGDGAVFPAGPMREPLAAGLARADAV